MVRAGLIALLLMLGASPALAAPPSQAACNAAVAYSTPRRGASVLVLYQGRVVCESYAGEGAADHGMEIWSGTKSFTGIMAAAAVQDGLLTLDEPVSKTLAEWRADPMKARVTLRQLLSLTSGLPGGRIGRAPGYAEAVAMALNAEPGTLFQYGPAPFQVFGEVMKRKLAAAGQDSDPLAYLHRRILDPIGLVPTDWRHTQAGDPLMPQGAVLTARQWAKFGEFVRAGGAWNGRQLVDPQAFRQLFIGSSAHPGYGISWWLPRPAKVADVVTASTDMGANADRLPPDLIVAAGAGDQRLYVIPSLGLTIVRQASFRPLIDGRERDPATKWSDTRFLLTLIGN
ncbi:CubicO group peptidase (beta-lactamase class C family) [Caulobacter ginsengisoli]|uniref:CubicO group peptidase (Beta-lactamase class C family) n=1 Tax=Caulobacter ginsengisoli TaxID=400775 RepID=A0ABU0IP36_9CAUL|nr:serine hydrolase [Caulobacter ginsengisoli]MDQ0463762.1 CubicO group peptidase (beta-lactamase class C family) [Caulobacter ginsengisoli]